MTQACDLACVHCRASAQPKRNPLELSTDEGKHLIDEIAQMQVPVFVLTGGDPIKRPDLFELIEYARTVGVRVSLTPSATPLLTRDVIQRLKQSGLARLAVSLDGSYREYTTLFAASRDHLTAPWKRSSGRMRSDCQCKLIPPLAAAISRTSTASQP